jgi:hypothetical protein
MITLTTNWSVHPLSKAQKLSDQVETIMKNRERRFMYLIRNGRNDDAIAVGDEFMEWLNPDVEDPIVWYDEDELVDLYEQLKKEQKRRRRGKSQ